MEKVRLSETGQFVVPRSILDLHQWSAGAEFLLWDTGQELVMKPVAKFPPSQLEPPDAPSVYHGRPLSLGEIEQVIDGEAGQHV